MSFRYLTPWSRILLNEPSQSVGIDIPRLLENPKIHYCVHMSQMNPVNTFSPHFP